MAIKHVYNNCGKNSPARQPHSSAGCKKYCSTWASWDAGGVRADVSKQEVRRGLAAMNLPLALLHQPKSQRSREMTEGWFSLCLGSKFTGTENGRCKLSHLCLTDQQYRSYQMGNLPAMIYP